MPLITSYIFKQIQKSSIKPLAPFINRLQKPQTSMPSFIKPLPPFISSIQERVYPKELYCLTKSMKQVPTKQ